MRELSDKECDVIIDEARDGCNDGFVRLSYVYVRAGYAAGYRAAQAEAGIKPGPLDPCPNYGAMPPSLDRQPAATPSSSASEHLDGTASAVTDGPAAEPIADLCARLRRPIVPLAFGLEAADALERLARENAALRNANSSFASNAICHGSRANDLWTCPKAPCDYCLQWQTRRAERAEAERDALRECVRAADAIVADVRPTRLHDMTANEVAYGRARARVTL